MQRCVIDCQTGTITYVPLTPDELAETAARQEKARQAALKDAADDAAKIAREEDLARMLDEWRSQKQRETV